MKIWFLISSEWPLASINFCVPRDILGLFTRAQEWRITIGIVRTDFSDADNSLIIYLCSTFHASPLDLKLTSIYLFVISFQLWKLGKLAKRWYHQLKEDFSEIRPFEIEDKPLFEVDEFSIKK